MAKAHEKKSARILHRKMYVPTETFRAYNQSRRVKQTQVTDSIMEGSIEFFLPWMHKGPCYNFI